jgi:alkylation response protein AidB-like acyl-CoA dehydrogenase
MTLELQDHQRELARTSRRFLEARADVAVARRLMDARPNYDRDVHRRLATELGLQGLHIPEQLEGSGAGFVEVVLTMHELGRVLYPGPMLATAAATEAVLLAGDEPAMAELLPGLAGGERIGTVAIAESSPLWSTADIAVRAVAEGATWRLTGRKRFVIDGDTADVLIVAASTGGGISLFAVDAAAPGVGRRAVPTLDQTRALADVDLDGAPGRLLAAEGVAAPLLESLLDRTCVLLAAESSGVAERALEITLQYAIDRHQFGRPIGSFQAIKHRLADRFVALELARCAVDYAAHAVDAGSDDVRSAASIALAEAATAAHAIAAESIQIHGGIGFTWEHDAHLFFKRARANAALLGSVPQLRERLLQTLGV